ncbi:chorismate synthase [Pumilibacter muris]|uniref:chorismate synthase n=1 Tax=Pumilibacter muris TaxID=2941510 RepID=UPI00203D71C3|nr:chorismate synthase [Pumilibacter muris]
MKYLTAGESHGKGLVAILEGFPSNVRINCDELNAELKRRQLGYGRGGRMKIESDEAEILSGMFGSLTLGSPIAFFIKNRDFEKWREYTDPISGNPALKALTAVRPGHADLTGCVKYGFADARLVLERASARETAARVGVGALCKQLLKALGITVGSHVTEICGERSDANPKSAIGLNELSDANPVRCLSASASEKMRKKIDECMLNGDTAGGEIEVLASGMPAGVGSYVHYDRKLDAILAKHVMSVQSVKSVSVGAGAAVASKFGSQIHDEIFPSENGETARKTNNAGGIEGGMSNGETIVLRACVKPIPTLMKGLNTVDISSGKAVKSAPERSDYCAVPAAAVVIENVAAFALLDELLKTAGADDFQTLSNRVKEMRERKIR